MDCNGARMLGSSQSPRWETIIELRCIRDNRKRSAYWRGTDVKKNSVNDDCYIGGQRDEVLKMMKFYYEENNTEHQPPSKQLFGQQ